ncbi:MAG: hypothetical protein H6Q58_1732 [Firmicutes bacterium]|nr:hypothetical protein [Bacillota bacterium]
MAVLFTFILAQAAGLFGTLAHAEGVNQVEVVVQSNTGVIASGTADSLKASEALDQVLKSSGKESAVIEYGMISSIDGISNAADWSKYWFTAVNRNGSYAAVNDGINDLMLQNGDKFIVYYSAYDTYTLNKIEYSTTLPDKKLVISLSNEQLDWYSGNMVVTPVASATMKAWIDGQPVVLDQNKAVIENGLSAGKHSLKVSDYQTDTALMPRVVEDTFWFEVRNPECSVRVEGLNDTMVQGTAQGGTALEIVKNVLGNSSVDYKTVSNSWGEYITEIGGLAENDIAAYTGWMFYVKNETSIISPAVGMDSYVPAEGDEIVLYFTDFSVPYVNSITFNPDIVPVSGGFSMRFSYSYTDWTDWMNPSTAVKNIEGALVTVDDTNYVTDNNGEISIPGGLSAGTHTYRISGYNSGRLSTVVMDQGTFTIDGASSPSFNHSKSSYDSSIDRDNLLVSKDITGSISASAAVVKGYPDPWAYVSLEKLGMAVNGEYLEQAYSDIRRYGAADCSNTELEKLIIGLAASGFSPYSFAGYDLVSELYGRDSGSFLIADVIYGLLAMDYAGIPDSYGINRQTLKSRLLSMQVSDGTGWSLGDAMDPDITGAAICALSPYMGEQEAAAAVNRAVASLSGMVSESGYVNGHYGISSETNAFVILGLLSAGVNPEGISTLSDGTVVNFAKSKGDLVSAMLSFRSEGGMFRHTLDGGSNSIATEQCLRALIAINGYKESGEAYNFYYSKIKAESLKVYSSTAAESAAAQQAVSAADSTGTAGSQPSGSSAASGGVKTAGSSVEAEKAEEAEEAAVNAETYGSADDSSAADEPAAAIGKKAVYMTVGGGLVAMGLVGGAIYLILGRKEGLR